METEKNQTDVEYPDDTLKSPVSLIASDDDDDDDDFDNITEAESAEDEEEEEMPLLHYRRIFGSLQRKDGDQQQILGTECTCSMAGKVILNEETTIQRITDENITEKTNITRKPSEGQEIPIQQWQNQPIQLTFAGFFDGTIILFDSITGNEVISDETGPFSLAENNNSTMKRPIVAISMDSTGTQLAAIDTLGNCTIWSVKYSLVYRSLQRTTRRKNAASPKHAAAGAFSKFFWMMPTTTNETSSRPTSSSSTDDTLVPTLIISETKIMRIQYPKREYGIPTCLSLDPAYKNTKKLLIAFNSGKIVLTSRNWMRVPEHIVLPYSGPITDSDWKGIESLSWRGSLLAFADCSGIKFYDISTLKPIAHADRPIGARPSLYNIPFRPNLCFETSTSLLVAWGDCLLALTVRDHAADNERQKATETQQQPIPDHQQQQNQQQQQVTETPRRRTVQISMAWGLDCVAAGVVPLDAKHVAVLGINVEERDTAIELQVIERSTGMVVWSDFLPILGQQTKLTLLSSFAVPRMDNILEYRQGNIVDNAGLASILGNGGINKTPFVDSHLKWNMNMVMFDNLDTFAADNIVDDGSEDSDDYGFLLRRRTNASNNPLILENQLVPPPLMMIISSQDVVLARIRDIDDAIAHALELNKPALALRRAIPRVRQLRRYNMTELVNAFLRSVLRLQTEDPKKVVDPLKAGSEERHLSLRRVKLAADTLPILLGGQADLWEQWISHLQKIPGALFVARKVIPVRDPKLSRSLYASVLKKMLEEVEEMEKSAELNVSNKLVFEAQGHFLNALLSWGTTRVLREHMKLYEYLSQQDNSFEPMVRVTAESLNYRQEQTAVGYLDFFQEKSEVPAEVERRHHSHSRDSVDALYNIDEMITMLSKRVSIMKIGSLDSAVNENETAPAPGFGENSRIALDALARLLMMKNDYEQALKCFLILGSLHSEKTLEELEDEALLRINGDDYSLQNTSKTKKPYVFLLQLIAKNHLHQSLLDVKLLPDSLNSSPICSLIRLVGLELMGDFLIEHCIAPQQKSKAINNPILSYLVTGSAACKTSGERRGTLPMDQVAEQLAGSPKLFHWYLHLVFLNKPEIYVQFPNTANPPTVITKLHKKHLDLYIKYAGQSRDSMRALAGIEAYRVAEKTTPLLSFLKAVLKLGTIGPIEVAKMLEIERRGGAEISRTFALELAYILENFGDDSESEALVILDLYLKGAQSLMLAVAYAQRTKTFSSILWEKLIQHCLKKDTKSEDGAENNLDGSLFGSLLEAAALSGADLAHLVAQIPPGMQVEGLRPRLVAAVLDYRLKVKLHATSSEIAIHEKALLFEEVAQRARRGIRCEFAYTIDHSNAEVLFDKDDEEKEDDNSEAPDILPPTLRTKKRPERFHRAIALAIR